MLIPVKGDKIYKDTFFYYTILDLLKALSNQGEKRLYQDTVN